MDFNTTDCPLIPAPVKYPDPDEMNCFFCWKYNETRPRDKIKLNNAKYCRLYPKSFLEQSQNIIPKFDHCKTLYTKCDYVLEKCVHEILLKLEDELKSHASLIEHEMITQNELVDDMWVNSQRYLRLSRAGVCVKLYPEIISEQTEKRALCCFHRNLRKVNKSNLRLSKSLDNIRNTMADVEIQCSKLDKTIESPFVLGTYYLRPLHYIRGITTDVFQYFYQHLCKLKRWAELLDPGDRVSIEDYMTLIKPNAPFQDNLIENLQNCRCMRSKRAECIKEFTPC